MTFPRSPSAGFHKFFFYVIPPYMQKIVEEVLKTEAEAISLVEKAKTEAKSILEQAEAEAGEILRQAKKEAQDRLAKQVESAEIEVRSLHERAIHDAEEKNRGLLASDSPEIEGMIGRIVSEITAPEYMKD